MVFCQSVKMTSKFLFQNIQTFWKGRQGRQGGTCPNLFLSILGNQVGRVDPLWTYEQFSVAAAQKCSNTTKMGFCKCRHLLTIKSIFLIFFMLLVWLCKRPNLKYERKLKFLKIFHKSRNFRVGIFDTLKIPRFMKYFENFQFSLIFHIWALTQPNKKHKKNQKD